MTEHWRRTSWHPCIAQLVPIPHPSATPRALQACQADAVAEVEAWQASLLGALPAVRPTSPPPLQHVSALIVQVYAHRVRQLPPEGLAEDW